MTTLDIEKFNPTVAELTNLVEKSKGITAVDLLDDEVSKTHLKVVKTARIELRDARVKIEKAGKALRDDANAFNKAVLVKEKELIAIVEPEEKRLKGIEEEADRIVARKINEAQLPERKARMEALGFPSPSNIADEYIVAMDSLAFEVYYNGLVAEKQRLEKEEIERVQAEKDAELRAREEAIKQAEAKIEEEARAKAREAQARLDERARMEREALEAEEKARLKILADLEAEDKRKADAEKLALEEKNKLERQTKYKKFLADCGVIENDPSYRVENDWTTKEVTVWKKVATMKI